MVILVVAISSLNWLVMLAIGALHHTVEWPEHALGFRQTLPITFVLWVLSLFFRGDR